MKQQKAIPIIVLLKIIDLAQTKLSTAMEDLVYADFFLRGANLRLHQDFDNSGKQKIKYHHTWKHPLLHEQSDLKT